MSEEQEAPQEIEQEVEQATVAEGVEQENLQEDAETESKQENLMDIDSGGNSYDKIKGFTEANQEKFNKTAGRIRLKANEKNIALQQQLDEEKRLRKEMEARIPQPVRPELPSIPDQYDEDFSAKYKAREQAIQKQAAYDQQARYQDEQNKYAQQQRQEQEQKEWADKVTSYTDRSNKIGINQADLNAAGAVVAQARLPQEVVKHILDLDVGPQVTMYLRDNPLKLAEIQRMAPMDAAVIISTTIKEAAMGMIKQKDLPPDPASNFDGGGARAGKLGPKGAVYE